MFYQSKHASGVYSCCAVLARTKTRIFIRWRGPFWQWSRKCSKHMCFTNQNAQMLIFCLRRALPENTLGECVLRVRRALLAQICGYVVCALHFRCAILHITRFLLMATWSYANEAGLNVLRVKSMYRTRNITIQRICIKHAGP